MVKEILRWAVLGALGGMGYITFICPCDPLWACHMSEMVILLLAVNLAVGGSLLAG